jgi:hypothetical protein
MKPFLVGGPAAGLLVAPACGFAAAAIAAIDAASTDRHQHATGSCTPRVHLTRSRPWGILAKGRLTSSIGAGVAGVTMSGGVKRGAFAGEDPTAADVSLTPLRGDRIIDPLTEAAVTATVGP